MEKELKLETVAVTSGMLQAQVLKSKLESAGIPVLLSYESAGLIFGVTVDGLGAVRVQVPEEMAEEARSLIGEESAEDGAEGSNEDG